jgi:hypothetical protein
MELVWNRSSKLNGWGLLKQSMRFNDLDAEYDSISRNEDEIILDYTAKVYVLFGMKSEAKSGTGG